MSSRRANSHAEGSKAKTRAIQGTVLLGLVGGVGAYVGFEKTVHLTVDGQERTIHTFDAKVADVLADEGISHRRHDAVAPAPADALVDGQQISVRYGRQLDVTVDGKDQHLWSTATTVDEAIAAMGVHGADAYLSVNRDQPIGRQGLTFEIRTQRHVNILVDGRTIPMDTTDPTVGQVLADAGVTLQGQDSAAPAPASFPVDGQTITVERISGTQETKNEAIPFQTTTVPDPDNYVGSRITVTAGVPGVQQVTYAYLTVNGVQQSPKIISKKVTKQPSNAVVKVGTKPVPHDRRRRRRPELGRAGQVRVRRQPQVGGQFRLLLRAVPVLAVDLGQRRRLRAAVAGDGRRADLPRQALVRPRPCFALAGVRPPAVQLSGRDGRRPLRRAPPVLPAGALRHTMAPDVTPARRARPRAREAPRPSAPRAPSTPSSPRRPQRPPRRPAPRRACSARPRSARSPAGSGSSPTKKLGQNFVIDPNTIRRIVRAGDVTAEDVVVEVGPGLGSLTLGLLDVARRVVAVEIDPVLAAALPETLGEFAPGIAAGDVGFELVRADALKVRELPGPPPTALVANLPYNVAVPVLLHMLERFPTSSGRW